MPQNSPCNSIDLQEHIVGYMQRLWTLVELNWKILYTLQNITLHRDKKKIDQI